jgi:collagenase-like PrtC family protease
LNSQTAKFYQNLGASGITIPRHLTISEIGEIVKDVSDIELCVFILNARCPNVDGFCTFLHIQSPLPFYKNACMLPYSIGPVRLDLNNRKNCINEEELEEKIMAACVRQQVWERYHMDDIPCGACALYEFKEMGINYVKIVGRGNSIQRKVNDIKFIKTAIALLKNPRISKKNFRDEVRRRYSQTFRLPCREIMCYYPEVMNDEGIKHNQ